MDNPSLPTAIMGVATSVISLGVVLLKGLRSRRVMPREPHVNRDYERETYMNDILCRGDKRCLKFWARIIYFKRPFICPLKNKC